MRLCWVCSNLWELSLNSGTYNDFKEEKKKNISEFLLLFDDNHFFCGT